VLPAHPFLAARQIPDAVHPEIPDGQGRLVHPDRSEMYVSDAWACVLPDPSVGAVLALQEPAAVAARRLAVRAVFRPLLRQEPCTSAADRSVASPRAAQAAVSPALPERLLLQPVLPLRRVRILALPRALPLLQPWAQLCSQAAESRPARSPPRLVLLQLPGKLRLPGASPPRGQPGVCSQSREPPEASLLWIVGAAAERFFAEPAALLQLLQLLPFELLCLDLRPSPLLPRPPRPWPPASLPPLRVPSPQDAQVARSAPWSPPACAPGSPSAHRPAWKCWRG
jgi:hypothetical protein